MDPPRMALAKCTVIPYTEEDGYIDSLDLEDYH